MKPHGLVFVLALLLAAAPPAPAVTPREEVLRLVPDDVGFCLLVQDLRGHAKAFFDSPFVAKLCASPVGAKILNAPEALVLSQVKTNLENTLGLPLSQLRDEILGDAFVLAYRPGPPGKPELEQGLIALRARDSALLARLVDRINNLQRLAGELKDLEARKHHDHTYQRRVLTNGINYYFLDEGLLIFATGEPILKDVLNRYRVSPSTTKDFAVARQFEQLGLDQHLAALWINPRTFEPALRRRAAEVGGIRAVALKTFLTYWEALESVAVTVSVRKDLELGLTLRGNKDRLPKAGQRFLATAARTSELWQCFPADAILTLACRLDVLAFADMLGDFLPEPARATVRAAVEQSLGVLLHTEVLRKILPQVGPDWGFCVLQPHPDEKGLIPPFVMALRVRRDGAESTAPQEVLSTVNAWVDLLVKVHNQVHGATMVLQTLVQDKVEVRFLTDDSTLPLGFRPAFALKGGYLLFASSPSALARFPATPPELPAVETGEVPLARFSPKALGSFLKARRPALASHLAVIHQLPEAEISKRLDGLVGALELLDQVAVVKRLTAEQVSLILRVRTVAPLR